MPRASTSRSNGEDHTRRHEEAGDGNWLTSRPGNSSDDVPNGGPDDPPQTEEERREIRKNLRRVVEKLNRDEEELLETDPTNLKQILEEAQVEFQRVKTPREGVIQSKCVALFASLAKRKAQNLTTEFVRFNPVEFVEKVLTFTQNSVALEEDGSLSKEGWNFLGEKCQPYFQRAAPFKCMLGTFERGEVITGRVHRQRAVREKENIKEGEETRLKEVKQAELSSLETTTREVEERVLPRLNEVYEQVGRKPICYFEFITNPNSYTHTVENIFHVSFLVKSGHAELFLDEDRLPVIRPNLDMEAGDETSGAMTQMIQSLSYQQWKDIVETFQISEPLLEPKVDS